MRFKFYDKKLKAIFFEGKHFKKYLALEEDIIEVIDAIDAAKDTRDLYSLTGLHFEKLKGKMKGKHSLILKDQFRLIVEIDKDDKGECLAILGVEDYH